MVDIYRAASRQGKYQVAILFFFGCSEVSSTWLITSELANQRARKAQFTCVVYTNIQYQMTRILHCKGDEFVAVRMKRKSLTAICS